MTICSKETSDTKGCLLLDFWVGSVCSKPRFSQNAQEGPACQGRRGLHNHADSVPTSGTLLAKRLNGDNRAGDDFPISPKALGYWYQPEKKARPPFRETAPGYFSSMRAAPYLLQLAHSSHLPLQQAAQSLSLQHSGQLDPAAWTDATAATKARAMAVISDFMCFLS
jgi:hypothetical protein